TGDSPKHPAGIAGPVLLGQSETIDKQPKTDLQPAGKRANPPSNQVAIRDIAIDPQQLVPLPPITGHDSTPVTVVPMQDDNGLELLPPVESSRRVIAQPAAFPISSSVRPSTPIRDEQEKPQNSTPRNELR